MHSLAWPVQEIRQPRRKLHPQSTCRAGRSQRLKLLIADSTMPMTAGIAWPVRNASRSRAKPRLDLDRRPELSIRLPAIAAIAPPAATICYRKAVSNRENELADT